MQMHDKLIVALDLDSKEKAKSLIDSLVPEVKLFKVGSILFTKCGIEIINYINDKGAKVFLDLKFHDIPNTVQQSVVSAVEFNVFMITVHTQGGRAMLDAAIKGAREKTKELKIDRPLIVGVTVLTSESIGDIEKEVSRRAFLAKDAGLDGVVCSVHEVALVREQCGEKFIIVTPGIRPKGFVQDDQRRVATAEQAVQSGADYIVVGRPIVQAENPKEAALEMLKELG